MEFEPGPFWDRDEAPFAPRVITEGVLEALLEPLVSVLAGTDLPLGQLSDDVGRDVPDNVEAVYLTTAGAAEEQHFVQATVPDDMTAPALVDAGHGTEVYRQSVLGYLPQPDMPIDIDFDEPPPPPNSPGSGDGAGDGSQKD